MDSGEGTARAEKKDYFLQARYERWSILGKTFFAQRTKLTFLAFVTETVIPENSGMSEKSLLKLSYLKLNLKTNWNKVE